MAMRLKKGDLVKHLNTGTVFKVRGPVKANGCITLYGRGYGGEWNSSAFTRAPKARKKAVAR